MAHISLNITEENLWQMKDAAETYFIYLLLSLGFSFPPHGLKSEMFLEENITSLHLKINRLEVINKQKLLHTYMVSFKNTFSLNLSDSSILSNVTNIRSFNDR